MDHHHEPAQHAVCRAQRAALMRLERMRLTTNPTPIAERSRGTATRS
jgi:hypothetical protein